MQNFLVTYKNPYTKKEGHQRIFTSLNSAQAKTEALKRGDELSLEFMKIEVWDGKW